MTDHVTGMGDVAVAVQKNNAIFTYKHEFFNLDMKTKLLEHVPRTNIMHLTYDTAPYPNDGLFEIALLFDRKKIANAILSKANLG